jgi:hypothetical protein
LLWLYKIERAVTTNSLSPQSNCFADERHHQRFADLTDILYQRDREIIALA